MKLPFSILKKKLNEAGLTKDKGEVITFAKFKKLVTIDQYGKGKGRLFILFVGEPKENLFAFYPMTDTRPNMLKEAYGYLVDIKEAYDSEDVVWGNCGYPLKYGKIRANF